MLFLAPETVALAASQSTADAAAAQTWTLGAAVAHLRSFAPEESSSPLMRRVLGDLDELEASIELLLGLDAVRFATLASLQPGEESASAILELELAIDMPQGTKRSFSFAMLFQVFLLLLRLVFMAGNFLQAEDIAIRFLYAMRTVGFLLSTQQLLPAILTPLRIADHIDPEEAALQALVRVYAGVLQGTATRDEFRSSLSMLWDARFNERELKTQLAEALLDAQPLATRIDPLLRALAKAYKHTSQLNTRTIFAVFKTFFYQLIMLPAARSQQQEKQLLAQLTQRLVPSVVRRLHGRSLETDEPIVALGE